MKENKIFPKAETKNILIQELTDEVLVYDLGKNQAKCLNNTLAVIWEACDGTRDFSAIRRFAEQALQTKITDDVVFLALDELNNHQLLEKGFNAAKSLSQTSRREMIKKVGLTTVAAIPIIIAVTAPQAANALSPNCTNDNNCPSNCCFNGFCSQVNAGGLPDGQACFLDADCLNNCCDFNVCSPACGVCVV